MGVATSLLVVSAAASTGLGMILVAYPAEVKAIPSLRRSLDADVAKQRAALVKDYAADWREAIRLRAPYRGYDIAYDWQVVADTPRFLSLSLSYRSEGAAHGHSSFDATLWDKAAKLRRKPQALFASLAPLRRPFCAALDRERAARRERAVARSDDPFDACLDPAKVTMILGSAAGGRFDRVGFLLGSYEAGPYVEGTYEVTLPVTPAVIAAVRPEYRRFFAIKR